MTNTDGRATPLAYQVWGDPSTPPLLLLHGFMGSGEDWKQVADLLADAFYCIAPDLPGHGQSPFDPNCHGTFIPYIETVVTLLDVLQLDNVAAIGYSMGGRILMALAAAYPQRFDRLVFESASPGIADESERRRRRESDGVLADRLRNEPYGTFLDQWYDQALFGGLKMSSAYEGLLARRLGNDPEQLAAVLEVAGTGQQPSLWDHLGDLQAPALMVYGENDIKYRDLAAGVVAEHRRFSCRSVSDCSHAIHIENTQRFSDICREFLQHGLVREELL